MRVAPAYRDRVLMIGHDAQSQRLVLELSSAGFEVLQVEADPDGLGRAINHAPHLIVLNGGTSPRDSMGLLSMLRKLANVPIIMMGPDGAMPLLQSLDLGADMYLTSATSSREVLAYARALLRRHALVNAAIDMPTPAEAGVPSGMAT